MSWLSFLIIFLITSILSFGFTFIIRKIALKLKLFDLPSPRRIHKIPIPRLGGIGIFLSFLIMVLFFTTKLGGNFLILDKHLIGFLSGATLLVFVMIFDDLYGLSPWIKIFWQLIAALIIIIFGIGINFLTNPFGGAIHLDFYQIPVVLFGITYHINVINDLFTIVWIIGVINITNFLDGIDGLAAGISAIAAFIIFILSIFIKQPDIALLAIILAGSAFGFLFLNFNPAKIFMGDSGSHFLGFSLAVLAIISGGKVATAFLVLGLPIIDGAWVALNRIFQKKSPFKADKSHFHHKLLDLGFSQRQIVLLFYFISFVFGISALFLKGIQKFLILIILIAIALITVGFLVGKIEKIKFKDNK